MKFYSITELRNHLSDLANRVSYGGQRIYVGKNGKPAFALVPLSDIKALEAMEDAGDEKMIRQRSGEPGEDWDQVKRELGL